MTPFFSVTGVAAALPMANIDTDVIMPKVFLKGVDRSGLAVGVFHDLRFDASGKSRPEFVLNRSGHESTRFLLVGPNFGCGSSREHAVWGLLQFGIRAIVGTSFAGIFADNAANNGLLLARLEDAQMATLLDAAASERLTLEIDLEAQVIRGLATDLPFAIEPGVRCALMRGLDRIDETLAHAPRIRRFEQEYLAERSWLADGRGG